VTTTAQPIGCANNVDITLLDDVEWDGILGMAYPNPALARQGIYPLFDNLMRQHAALSSFAYYLGEEGGALTIGGVDPRYVASSAPEPFYTPVVEKNYWTIQVSTTPYLPHLICLTSRTTGQFRSCKYLTLSASPYLPHLNSDHGRED
jgi:hypothetical protein